MESKEAIEIMFSRGYKNTATGANGNLFFLKKINEQLDLHGTVIIKTESVYLDIIGALDMGISIRSLQMSLDSEQMFTKTEERLLTYVSILRDDVTHDSESKIKSEPIPIETRKSGFWQIIRQVGKEKGYQKEMCTEFYDYWTEKNPAGKKLRFETEKIFDVTRRLNTWLQHDKKWSKTFVDKKADQQNKELEETGTTSFKKSDLF